MNSRGSVLHSRAADVVNVCPAAARSQASDLVQQKIDEKLPWVAEKMAARRRLSASNNALTDNTNVGVVG